MKRKRNASNSKQHSSLEYPEGNNEQSTQKAKAGRGSPSFYDLYTVRCETPSHIHLCHAWISGDILVAWADKGPKAGYAKLNRYLVIGRRSQESHYTHGFF